MRNPIKGSKPEKHLVQKGLINYLAKQFDLFYPNLKRNDGIAKKKKIQFHQEDSRISAER